MTFGYIYIRHHPAYDVHNACKIGKTDNIPSRDSTYVTGEIERGIFKTVIEVPREFMDAVEHLIHEEFKKFNIRKNGGTEFFDKQVISLIEPFLQTLNLKYRYLSEQEIEELSLKKNDSIPEKNIDLSILELLKKSKDNKVLYEPRDYQVEIIDKAYSHLKEKQKGLLVLICGIGKTLISLWTIQKLNVQNFIIGVYNELLLIQWKKVVKILFPNTPIFVVKNGVDVQDISNFLIKNSKNNIVITTYKSSIKVYEALDEINYRFDAQINDEAHHLTSMNIDENERKTFIYMLKLRSVLQLSLTATMKIIESTSDKIVSNDSIKYFGEVIEKRSLQWAIQKDIICDYLVQTLVANEEKLEQQFIKYNITKDVDKRLFLSAYASLKSIQENHSSRLLVYTNSKTNSEKIIRYINLLKDEYFTITDFFCSNYCSDMDNKEQQQILENFEKYSFGVISCVYCLGEGWDNPSLDGVVFAENMISFIRIVQNCLRASRKNKAKPEKIAKIILPVLHQENWLDNNNSDFKKVKEVIYQLGMEDDTISQKIKCYNLTVTKQQEESKQGSSGVNDKQELGEYDEELTQKIRLKTTKRTALVFTAYEKAKEIVLSHNIKTKEEYFELCNKDNRLCRDPENIYKGKFTSWIDYLDIKKVYYDIQTCKNKVKDFLSYSKVSFEPSKIAKELCLQDKMFPPYDLWCEYYKINDLTEIIKPNHKKKNTVKF